MRETNINVKRNTNGNNDGHYTGSTSKALKEAEKDISNDPDLSPNKTLQRIWMKENWPGLKVRINTLP